jgi:hypothetical protein
MASASRPPAGGEGGPAQEAIAAGEEEDVEPEEDEDFPTPTRTGNLAKFKEEARKRREALEAAKPKPKAAAEAAPARPPFLKSREDIPSGGLASERVGRLRAMLTRINQFYKRPDGKVVLPDGGGMIASNNKKDGSLPDPGAIRGNIIKRVFLGGY